MEGDRSELSVDAELHDLRQRADEDFLSPPEVHVTGRHQIDLPSLGVRVSVTRSRYPDRSDGADQYAVTVSRLGLAHTPEEAQTRRVLFALFGAGADQVQERGGGSNVRMFRVQASAVPPLE